MTPHVPDIVREQFEMIEVHISSCEVVRDFPWSYVIRLTTSTGDTHWAKRCGDGMAFEPALTAVVDAIAAPVTIPSLWIAGRWIATEHVGGQLRRGDERMLDAMARLQAPFAALQQEFVRCAEQLVATGIPTLGSRDVEPLAERVIELCARDSHLARLPLTPEEAGAFQSVIPRFREHIECLEALSDIRTVQHLDLHYGNVFDPGDGIVQIFDWGDARIGSPLLHLVSTVSLLGYVIGVDTRAPRILEVCEAYLAAWPDLVITAATWDLLHDPRLAAYIRMDALAAALRSGHDDVLSPFADWLPELVRAAASRDPARAQGVRLA